MCEVFFDTSLLCMLTGFSVLLSGVSLGGSGIEIILNAMSASFGSISKILIFLLILFFAYSTVVCWYFYGMECVYYLTGKERCALYSFVFLLTVILGAVITESVLISVSDYILFFMTLITLITLLKNSERVCRLSE